MRKSTKILSFAKKIKAVKLLGGCCKNCGETNIHKLCFHHRDETEKYLQLSILKNYRWSLIELELMKCDLLCQNCHQELHKKYEINNRSNVENKKIYFEYIGQKECEICGYNKCMNSLSFHHLSDKDFMISNVRLVFNSIEDLTEQLKNELDKCQVLCRNCHIIKHADVIFLRKIK